MNSTNLSSTKTRSSILQITVGFIIVCIGLQISSMTRTIFLKHLKNGLDSFILSTSSSFSYRYLSVSYKNITTMSWILRKRYQHLLQILEIVANECTPQRLRECLAHGTNKALDLKSAIRALTPDCIPTTVEGLMYPFPQHILVSRTSLFINFIISSAIMTPYPPITPDLVIQSMFHYQ